MDARVAQSATAWYQSPAFTALIGVAGTVIGAVVVVYFNLRTLRANHKQQMPREKSSLLITGSGLMARGVSEFATLRNMSAREAFDFDRPKATLLATEGWLKVDEAYGTLSLLVSKETLDLLGLVYENCRSIKEILHVEYEDIKETLAFEDLVKQLPDDWRKLQSGLRRDADSLAESTPDKEAL